MCCGSPSGAPRWHRAPAWPGSATWPSSAAAAGLTVRVEQDGERRPLPAEVDLAAYRIIQEALTNSARHSGGSTATVYVGYGEDDIVVQVDDNGTATGPWPGPAARQGRFGRQRHRGHDRAGARPRRLAARGAAPGGGFRVRARLPLRGTGR